MAHLTIIKPKSFSELLAEIENIQGRKDYSMWFRGCGKASYKLIPTLYRHPKIKKNSDLVQLENELVTRFRQRSIPFSDRSLTDDWDTLFYMQHYGVPTRLLDWTENPFIAIYFSVMSAPYTVNKGKIAFDEPAAIWILDPILWNKEILSYMSFSGQILVPGDTVLSGYMLGADLKDMNDDPVGIYGAHNSSRIVAQRGAFTIFGKVVDSMESIYEKKKPKKESLTKIVLDKRYIPKIRKSILNYGITESVVFPDLEGLSKEIKRNFEFEV